MPPVVKQSKLKLVRLYVRRRGSVSNTLILTLITLIIRIMRIIPLTVTVTCVPIVQGRGEANPIGIGMCYRELLQYMHSTVILIHDLVWVASPHHLGLV